MTAVGAIRLTNWKKSLILVDTGMIQKWHANISKQSTPYIELPALPDVLLSGSPMGEMPSDLVKR